MGLFSGVGHFFKSIVNGAKSAFKWVGKVLNSKIGRIVMIAAAVVTCGVALVAGVGAALAASSGGFMSAVTSGGSAFVSAIAHPIAAASAEMGSGAEAAGTALASGAGANAASEAAQIAQAGSAGGDAAAASNIDTALTSQAGGGAADSVAGTGAQATGPGVGSTMTTPGGYTINTPGGATGSGGTGLLSQAKQMAAGPGLTIINKGGSSIPGAALQAAGSLAQGYASGAAQEKVAEDQRNQENYYGELWNPAKQYTGNVGGAGVINAAGQAGAGAVNPGYLSMAQNIAGFMSNKAAGSPPTFGAPNIQPGAPTTTNVSPIAPTGPAKPTTTGA